MADLEIHNYGRREPPKGVRVWTTEEVREDFIIHSFLAPMVRVTRRSDGAKGWMEFTHMPRFYFAFRPDDR